MKPKNSKRILSVTIRRMIDENPDTSWLGEYSNSAETEYAIDRKHSLDCPINTGVTPLSQKTRTAIDAQASTCECADPQCDCEERGDMSSREYRFFNGPIENYKGEPSEDIRKYILQDYKRMESLNRGDWCFIGLRAVAQIWLNSLSESVNGYIGPTQTITSGGLWGIESDAVASFITEEEQDQLAELKDQLIALGFSLRAISNAFKNVQHKEG